MDYKEKYEMALEGIQEILGSGEDSIKMSRLQLRLQGIFPELKESESKDEKIRKEIIDIIDSYDVAHLKAAGLPSRIPEYIAWLEKQGEQKSVDNAKPKFHEGEWVVVSTTKGDRVVQIASVEYFKDGYPSYITTEGRWFGNGTKARLLTDKDVETITLPESKVIVNQKPADETKLKIEEGKWYVCISQFCNCIEGRAYKATSDSRIMDDFGTEYDIHSDAYKYFQPWTIQDAKDGDVLAYNDGSLTIFRYRLSGLDAGLYMSHILLTDKIEFKQTCAISNVHPATKEQRDTLLKAMADAEYTFNFEKKELRKIKFRVGDEVKTKNEESLTITRIDEEGYWSNDLFICDFDSECIWDLVEQKPAWSEEDEKNSLDIKCLIANYRTGNDEYELCSWIDKIKDRVQPKQEWKPSDEQITVLHDVAAYIDNSIYPNQKDILVNLYLQLKKLREE